MLAPGQAGGADLLDGLPVASQLSNRSSSWASNAVMASGRRVGSKPGSFSPAGEQIGVAVASAPYETVSFRKRTSDPYELAVQLIQTHAVAAASAWGAPGTWPRCGIQAARTWGESQMTGQRRLRIARSSKLATSVVVECSMTML